LNLRIIILIFESMDSYSNVTKNSIPKIKGG
jgi:hypothetical protein